MLSVSSTMLKKIKLLGIGFIIFTSSKAQTENSPYSRYGLGDVVPSQNIIGRSMGGLAAAYFDYQSINFLNPASYSRLKVTTLDFGLELDNRTIRALNPPRKFSSSSPIISYVQLGVPLSTKKNVGLNFGLRPLTRINYKIERNERLADIDSINTLFEGNGGAYEVFAGLGAGTKNFSVGVNVGYLFGSKNYATRITLLPDSSDVFYYQSNHERQANYNGLFINAGAQYAGKIGKTTWLRLGAYGNLKKELKGTRDVLHETFNYNATTGALDSIDVVSNVKDVSGKVVYPAQFGAGFIIERESKWMLGADLATSKWNDYRFFGETDQVQDSWKLHVGGQVIPNALSPKSYWNRVAYRAGFQYGQDYIKVDNDLPVWGVSLGAGLPMRRAQYTYQMTMLNVGFEFGQRGNKENLVRENFFRVSVGLSLSDIWFQKRKYD